MAAPEVQDWFASDTPIHRFNDHAPRGAPAPSALVPRSSLTAWLLFWNSLEKNVFGANLLLGLYSVGISTTEGVRAANGRPQANDALQS